MKNQFYMANGLGKTMREKRSLPGVRITSDRCLVLDDGPTVVLGDLHLGYERALEQEGMYLPRINTDSIRESLNTILSRYEPTRVVLLGAHSRKSMSDVIARYL